MRWPFSALVCALAVLPTAADAQPADSFPGLMGLIELREYVTVTYGAGQIVQGRAVAVSPSSLTVLAGDTPLELDAERVLRVRQRWDDPTGDGGLKGFAVGAVPLVVLFLKGMQQEGEQPGAMSLAGLGLAAGALGTAGFLIGAGIDAGKKDMRDIYRAPARRPRAAAAPLLFNKRAGAALSITW